MEERKKYLRLKDVGLYIKERTGLDVCRATVYNWTTKGRIAYDGRRIILQTVCKLPVRVTTEEWVEDFLQEFQSVA